MQAKDAIKMTTDDKRRKRQGELDYKRDTGLMLLAMLITLVLATALLICMFNVAVEVAKPWTM